MRLLAGMSNLFDSIAADDLNVARDEERGAAAGVLGNVGLQQFEMFLVCETCNKQLGPVVVTSDALTRAGGVLKIVREGYPEIQEHTLACRGEDVKLQERERT